jgi:hypothetical protein
VVLERPITLDGQGAASLIGNGSGSVITVTGTDITIRGLEIRGSGSSHETIDSGLQLRRTAERVLVEGSSIRRSSRSGRPTPSTTPGVSHPTTRPWPPPWPGSAGLASPSMRGRCGLPGRAWP